MNLVAGTRAGQRRAAGRRRALRAHDGANRGGARIGEQALGSERPGRGGRWHPVMRMGSEARSHRADAYHGSTLPSVGPQLNVILGPDGLHGRVHDADSPGAFSNGSSTGVNLMPGSLRDSTRLEKATSVGRACATSTCTFCKETILATLCAAAAESDGRLPLPILFFFQGSPVREGRGGSCATTGYGVRAVSGTSPLEFYDASRRTTAECSRSTMRRARRASGQAPSRRTQKGANLLNGRSRAATIWLRTCFLGS